MRATEVRLPIPQLTTSDTSQPIQASIDCARLCVVTFAVYTLSVRIKPPFSSWQYSATPTNRSSISCSHDCEDYALLHEALLLTYPISTGLRHCQVFLHPMPPKGVWQVVYPFTASSLSILRATFCRQVIVVSTQEQDVSAASSFTSDIVGTSCHLLGVRWASANQDFRTSSTTICCPVSTNSSLRWYLLRFQQIWLHYHSLVHQIYLRIMWADNRISSPTSVHFVPLWYKFILFVWTRPIGH